VVKLSKSGLPFENSRHGTERSVIRFELLDESIELFRIRNSIRDTLTHSFNARFSSQLAA
jgi:hypothetical protein